MHRPKTNFGQWFHPNLTNAQAESLLLEQGCDGSFLVRPCESSAGSLSLSVRRGNEVQHIRIRHAGDFFDLYGGERFSTLADLIDYYTQNTLKEINGDTLKLRTPLYTAGPTNERWFHGCISGIEVERMLLEKGVYGSFLVRESQSAIGHYVLTVRTKDESTQNDKISQVMIQCSNGKYDIGGGPKFDSLADLVEHYKGNPLVETDHTVINMKHPFNATKVPAYYFEARVRELSKSNDSGFWGEFEQIKQQEFKVMFDRKVGQELRNINNNRYKNVLPYDYTRVILKRDDLQNEKSNQFQNQFASNVLSLHQAGLNENEQTDYINANYIKIVPNGSPLLRNTKPVPYSKVYISTQGPLPNTMNDFWWMIWQEKSKVIVMVTQEVERSKNKCSRYWPELNMQINYGRISVKNVKEICEKEYNFREFLISYQSESRSVSQWQHLSWPDLNTPSDPTSILEFVDRINQPINSDAPVIVHCSAGIGRSGAFIVIDFIIDQLKYFGLNYDIDIQNIVHIARTQRPGLVQTEAQYKFIYLAIKSYIKILKGELK